MELISVTNRKTVLHKNITDLAISCSEDKELKNTISKDVSFFGAQKLFATIYKNADILEFWRVKSGANGEGMT